MTSRLQDLYIYCQAELPGMETPYLLHRLQLAAREFCRVTEAWREDVSFYIKDAPALQDAAYDAAIANSMSTAAATQAGQDAYDAALKYQVTPNYDAEVLRVFDVWDGGDVDLSPVDNTLYEHNADTQLLRFKNQLKTYSPTATAWATTTSYAVGDFVYLSHLGHTHRYLCAIAHTSGTFATDLAAYKWQLMPDELIVRIVLMPRLNSVELAAWFMERWAEAIVARVKADCMVMANKTWSAPDRAQYYESEYAKYLRQAKRETFTRNINDGFGMATPRWIP